MVRSQITTSVGVLLSFTPWLEATWIRSGPLLVAPALGGRGCAVTLRAAWPEGQAVCSGPILSAFSVLAWPEGQAAVHVGPEPPLGRLCLGPLSRCALLVAGPARSGLPDRKRSFV